MTFVEARPQGTSLRDLVRQGYIAPIWSDGREILRRLFVTVRDRHWREVAPAQFEYALDETAGTVSFSARHVNEDVDFEWHGILKVSDSSRELGFAIEGRALRDMEVCRVGLVVLHPVESMVGSQVSVRGPQGDQLIAIPHLISPQPMVNGIPQAMTEPFSRLVIERLDFGRLELRFSGDLFELEDQRNWGDASFKTYCTPLRLGFPRKVEAGASIAHSLEARFAPATHPIQPSAVTRAGVGRGVFPSIKRESPLLQITKPADMTSLRSVLALPAPNKVELRVELGTSQMLPPQFVALLSRFSERIERLLISGPGTSLPCAQAIERLRQKLESSGPLNFPLVAATQGYFVEFNRGVKFEAPVGGVAFPFTATVHGDDTDTITENVAALVDIAETARHLTGVSEIVISPLALYYPRVANPSRFPKVLVRPWFTATLIHAALAGMTSITLAADVLGALESAKDGFLPGLLECAGREIAPTDVPLPAGVHGLKLVSKGSEPARMLVANLGSRAVNLVLDKHEVEIAHHGTAWIDLSK